MIWLVGIGGIFGAICRYLLSHWIGKKSFTFPYATWIANLSGSFAIGCLIALYLENHLSDVLWFSIGIGFLGSYTTMSTFGYEAIQLVEKNKNKLLFYYVASSVVLGLFFAWLGWLITKELYHVYS